MKTKLNVENIFKNYKDVVTIRELQEMLGIGKNLAYKLISEKHINYIKIGSRFYIPKQSIIDFINSDEV